ncbi:hypothetical protein D3C72_1966730 [compost metagenome]
MAQRHQASHALQQIQTHCEDGHDHHACDHLHVEITADDREQQQRSQPQCQRELHAARQHFDMGAGGAHRGAPGCEACMAWEAREVTVASIGVIIV